jgi:hypothetical protein
VSSKCRSRSTADAARLLAESRRAISRPMIAEAPGAHRWSRHRPSGLPGSGRDGPVALALPRGRANRSHSPPSFATYSCENVKKLSHRLLDLRLVFGDGICGQGDPAVEVTAMAEARDLPLAQGSVICVWREGFGTAAKATAGDRCRRTTGAAQASRKMGEKITGVSGGVLRCGSLCDRQRCSGVVRKPTCGKRV